MTTLVGTTTCSAGTIGATCVGGTSDGIGTNAQFWNPKSIVVNPNGLVLYVTDSSNGIIRIIRPSSGILIVIYVVYDITSLFHLYILCFMYVYLYIFIY